MARKPPSAKAKGARRPAAARAAAPGNLDGLERKALPVKEAPAADTPLNPRQERFCEEYLVDLNGTEAYIRAGYDVKSRDVAGATAARLLADARVQKRVAELKASRSERLGISVDRVVEATAQAAYLDIRQFFGKDGKMLALHLLPAEIAMALTGFEQDGKTTKVKFDRMRALELLGKHVGAFKERMVHQLDPEDPVVRMFQDIYNQPGNRWTPKPVSGVAKRTRAGKDSAGRRSRLLGY